MPENIHVRGWFLGWALLLVGSCHTASEQEHYRQVAASFVRLVWAHEYELAMALLDDRLVAEPADRVSLQVSFSDMEARLRRQLGQLSHMATAFWEKRVVRRTDWAHGQQADTLVNYVLELVGIDSVAYVSFSFSNGAKILQVGLHPLVKPRPTISQQLPFYLFIALGWGIVGLMAFTCYRLVRDGPKYLGLWILLVVLGHVGEVGYGVLYGGMCT